jgi:hypothetical protein
MLVAIKRGTEPEDGGDHRTLSPKVPMTEDGVTRMPYRYAVGLMIETDEVSEQLPCSRSGTKMDENEAGLASIAYGR